MAKLAIDLLPQEFRIEQLKKAKFYKVQAVGIATILLVTFASSVTIGLRILQSQNMVQVQNRLKEAENRVIGLKNTQASLLLLKNRLTVVSQYLEVPSKGVSMYKLISELLPQSIAINSISIGKDGEILVLATASDALALEQLFTSLTSKETSQDKIEKVSMDNLSRGRDGLYRLNFTVKPR